ncbi:hypothetical protein HSHS1_17540 [Helicobacter suis HS1]|nr:hypothetical protein HSHS1_17540 [Helicobacter suis HS1]
MQKNHEYILSYAKDIKTKSLSKITREEKVKVFKDEKTGRFLFAKTINLQKLGLNYIDEKFLDSDSFTANFIEKIGGNNFKFTIKV